MPFDSPLFLLAFLPVILGLFAICPARGREILLFLASLLFYALGGVRFLPLLLAATAFNMAMGLLIERSGGVSRRAFLALGVVVDLAVLVWSKYLGFLATELPGLSFLNALSPQGMPLGVSFFTFSAVAYLVDIARGTGRAERDPVRFGLFLAFFAKITAGPIARHSVMFAQPGSAQAGAPGAKPASATPPGQSGLGRPSLEDLREGLIRMAVGLAKKVLLAGAMAPLADAAFGAEPGSLDAGTAWIGLASYSFQLYFDFSGYTDMAVGLGRMFGYRVPENFNYPYVSQSVREFWRRWHITLSTWFRDYLYIPLGGGRVAPWKVQRNLLVVFALCGLWHGASWSFLAWGLWHGVFLALERTALGGILDRLPRPFRHAYALLAVGLGWVFFRAIDLSHAVAYLKALAGGGLAGFDYTWMVRMNHEYLAMLAFCLAGSLPVIPWMAGRIGRPADAAPAAKAGSANPGGPSPTAKGEEAGIASGQPGRLPSWMRLAAPVLAGFLLALSLLQLAAGTHSPFIYAQF